jgi:hypothetical protein
MHVPINIKSPNNITKWQTGFNSAFQVLNNKIFYKLVCIWLVILFDDGITLFCFSGPEMTETKMIETDALRRQ